MSSSFGCWVISEAAEKAALYISAVATAVEVVRKRRRVVRLVMQSSRDSLRMTILVGSNHVIFISGYLISTKAKNVQVKIWEVVVEQLREI